MLTRTTIECLVKLDLLLQATSNFARMLQASTVDFAQLALSREGFLACIDSFSGRKEIAPKVEGIVENLQSSGFEVVGARSSKRGGLSELDTMYEEFAAFLAGIRSEICRRFNGTVVSATKAIESMALTALDGVEESALQNLQLGAEIVRDLPEHLSNGTMTM
ncbi:hypothetical protein FOL47_008616 [Perkinsus chesapeaki]|uniref:Uncharacterized protein n=1 Tax=Perkinsus chesapeaki TaxID=330153 RepID=A0A7J6LD20_PERCH|nr:hypothetical protein FOL47_008616 [Perkinsus chesapeaki]